MQQTTGADAQRIVKIRTKRDFQRYADHRARERRAMYGSGKFTPPAPKA